MHVELGFSDPFQTFFSPFNVQKWSCLNMQASRNLMMPFFPPKLFSISFYFQTIGYVAYIYPPLFYLARDHENQSISPPFCCPKLSL
jgi:hypothetical protein